MSETRHRRAYRFVMHGARAHLPEMHHLVGWVRAKGHAADVCVTWERGDATRFAREGAAHGVDAVVAVGGDGTVNEVLNGLVGTDVPLGVIPAGTANDFARQVGIPEDPNHAMDVILHRAPVRVDTADLNGRRFLNVSSAGVGAEVTAETPSGAKETLGPLAYVLAAARKLGALDPLRARFTARGFERVCDFLLVAVGNGRMTGGGTPVTPRARMTDGLLDVCIVEAMPMPALARLMLKVRRGEHLGEPGVHYFQCPELVVAAERPLVANVDGEPDSQAVLVYRAHPGDLLVHLVHLPDDGA